MEWTCTPKLKGLILNIFWLSEGATACVGIQCDPGTYGFVGKWAVRVDTVWGKAINQRSAAPILVRLCVFACTIGIFNYNLTETDGSLSLLLNPGASIASETTCAYCSPGTYSNSSGQ
jgi:hypothetical protein